MITDNTKDAGRYRRQQITALSRGIANVTLPRHTRRAYVEELQQFLVAERQFLEVEEQREKSANTVFSLSELEEHHRSFDDSLGVTQTRDSGAFLEYLRDTGAFLKSLREHAPEYVRKTEATNTVLSVSEVENHLFECVRLRKESREGRDYGLSMVEAGQRRSRMEASFADAFIRFLRQRLAKGGSNGTL